MSERRVLGMKRVGKGETYAPSVDVSQRLGLVFGFRAKIGGGHVLVSEATARAFNC